MKPWIHVQLCGHHPHPEVEHRHREKDAYAEAYAPDSRQVVFACGGQDDEENGNGKGSSELGAPSTHGPNKNIPHPLTLRTKLVTIMNTAEVG